VNQNDGIPEKLSSRKYDPTKKIDNVPVIFTIDGKVIGTTQSIVCVQGLPKQGKTLYLTSALASLYTPGDIYGMKLTFPKGRERVCYVDTESSEFDFYNNMSRTAKLMIRNYLPDTFDAFLMREDDPTDIKKMIEEYLTQNPSCGILVIDGVLDLISDFNSVEQSFYLLQWLKKITKTHDLLIIIVLHLGKKDLHGIGHIGSYLDRKSQSVLKIEKNKDQNTFDLTATYLRSADNLDPIRIAWNGSFFYRLDTEPINDPSAVQGIDKNFLLNRIMPEPVKYDTLVNDLAAAIGKGKTTAKKIIKEWILAGEILKTDQGYKQKART